MAVVLVTTELPRQKILGVRLINIHIIHWLNSLDALIYSWLRPHHAMADLNFDRYLGSASCALVVTSALVQQVWKHYRSSFYLQRNTMMSFDSFYDLSKLLVTSWKRATIIKHNFTLAINAYCSKDLLSCVSLIPGLHWCSSACFVTLNRCLQSTWMVFTTITR